MLNSHGTGTVHIAHTGVIKVLGTGHRSNRTLARYEICPVGQAHLSCKQIQAGCPKDWQYEGTRPLTIIPAYLTHVLVAIALQILPVAVGRRAASAAMPCAF